MFSESLIDGKYGERVVLDFLRGLPNVKSVVDVRQDKDFQEKDIDFLIEDKHQQFTSIEVKTDFKAHETGNLVYEVTTSGHIGCFEKTQAKYIAYYLPYSRTLYLINPVALRTYLHKIHPEPRKMGDNAEGFLIPLADLEKEEGIIFYSRKGDVV